MASDQDKGVEDTPKIDFNYILKKKQGDEGTPAECIEIYAGYALDGVGGPDFLYIAKAVRLLLQEDREPVERHALELYTSPEHSYTYYTDPKEAKSAINGTVSVSDEAINEFFEKAANRKKEPFNSEDYLQKGTRTEGTETTDLGKEQQA